MGWSRISKDAKRRYNSGYNQGRRDKKNNFDPNERGASSDDWLEGYSDGYNGRPNKYDRSCAKSWLKSAPKCLKVAMFPLILCYSFAQNSIRYLSS